MEDTISTFLGLACAVAPCLLLIGAIVGGIAFFAKRRKNKAPTATSPATTLPSQPNVVPAAATVQHAGSELSSQTALSELLVPSEVVALRGDLFAPSAGVVNSWKLVGSEMKVSGLPLAQNVLAAAFLALEQADDIRLELSKKKATFGLREVDTILAIPNGNSTDWPAASFEAKIVTSARNRQRSNRNNINDIVFDVLEQDAGIVWDWALRLAHNGMAKRGILATEVKKGLLSGGLAHYSPTSATNAALAQTNPAEVQQLLQSCAKDRPDLFKLLNKEIKSGLDARKEASDSDTGPDLDFD